MRQGRVLVWSGRAYVIKKICSFKAVSAWLRAIGVSHLASRFLHSGIDDFLVLPFVREEDLKHMRVTQTDEIEAILRGVKELQDTDNLVGMWIRYLGYPQYERWFRESHIDLQALPRLNEKELGLLGAGDMPAEHRREIFEVVKQYTEFSSIEASYIWMESQGFDEYAFHFVRYNIPFYALPLVNFFIISYMGTVAQARCLLDALKGLRKSPAYNVKAMAYWLRDLQLEHCCQTFAKHLFVNFIEALSVLTSKTISLLIDNDVDRERIWCAVKDAKEYERFYSHTAVQLQDLIMDKYAHLFATNPCIFDLPTLSDSILVELGITDRKDRQLLLSCVKKMQVELPTSVNKDTWLPRFIHNRSMTCGQLGPTGPG